MHKDFKDLLSEFNAHKVRYMIVGGYAYARYTEPRATKDLDIFIRADPENALAARSALIRFGAPVSEITLEDLAQPSTVIQIGVPPFRVDVILQIDGLTFDEAWTTSEEAVIDDEVTVRYISLDKLIVNKLASARPQDLLDVRKLRRAQELQDPE